jgi:hypothetical protein
MLIAVLQQALYDPIVDAFTDEELIAALNSLEPDSTCTYYSTHNIETVDH